MKRLDDKPPLVMGVLNVTPDSFSDGNQFLKPELAIDQAKRLMESGADLVDVGAESTRPGAQAVRLDEELRRLRPVLEGLSKANIPFSVDTYKPAVMAYAIEMGAGMINDIKALSEPGATEVLAHNPSVDIAIMHMQGTPDTMQSAPKYDNVVQDILHFFSEKVRALTAEGIQKERLWIDPGFGFGKKAIHNLGLLKALDTLSTLDLPILVGLSRKALMGDVLGKPKDARLFGSVACHLYAALNGAKMIRTHDVLETVQSLQLLSGNAVAADDTIIAIVDAVKMSHAIATGEF